MPRFLIVDDDLVSRETLRDILAPYGECDFAADGQEAIARFARRRSGAPYDLVCMDILMPNTGGHDALRGIRRMEADHGLAGSDGVKVIMTTAVRDSQHCLQAFREGCEMLPGQADQRPGTPAADVRAGRPEARVGRREPPRPATLLRERHRPLHQPSAEARSERQPGTLAGASPLVECDGSVYSKIKYPNPSGGRSARRGVFHD